MTNTILSINAGSSSLKITLYIDEKEDDVSSKTKSIKSLIKAEITGINSEKIKFKYGDDKDDSKDIDIKNHKGSFDLILKKIIEDDNISQIKTKKDIKFTCHRVVHGGNFKKDEIITSKTFHKIQDLSDLAPLHNASAVSLMIACHEELSEAKNIACFDSKFHHTLPEYIKSYCIDQNLAKEKGLRKYGFHGLSYSFIIRNVSKFLSKDISNTNIIALHLGSGASICAIKNGKSLDTSMSLTPVSGLPGSTRSGDIDPSLVFHYTSEASKLSPSSTKDLHISTAEEILNKNSGWKAVAGTTDFSEIATPNPPTESHKLALDIFVDRIVGFIGSYYVKLEGKVDALVFAGGIGEKSSYLRKLVVEKCSCLGFTLDEKLNESKSIDSDVVDIGKKSEKDSPRTLICQTDEDYEMAYNTMLHMK